jgi:hypothetical protein
MNRIRRQQDRGDDGYPQVHAIGNGRHPLWDQYHEGVSG